MRGACAGHARGMCEACAGHARGMREACENRTYTDPVSDPVPDFALDSHPPQLSFLGEIKITCNSSMYHGKVSTCMGYTREQLSKICSLKHPEPFN